MPGATPSSGDRVPPLPFPAGPRASPSQSLGELSVQYSTGRLHGFEGLQEEKRLQCGA